MNSVKRVFAISDPVQAPGHDLSVACAMLAFQKNALYIELLRDT